LLLSLKREWSFLSLVVAVAMAAAAVVMVATPSLVVSVTRLVSNSSNTTLAASVSHLPPAPGQPAILSLLPSPALRLHPPLPAVVVYTDDIAASAIGSEPDPISGWTSPDNAAAKLTHSALMICILAKNDSSKNNSASSVDAVKGM